MVFFKILVLMISVAFKALLVLLLPEIRLEFPLHHPGGRRRVAPVLAAPCALCSCVRTGVHPAAGSLTCLTQLLNFLLLKPAGN